MLHYDIDWRQLLQVGEELQATDKQVIFALSRGLRRTEATIRKLSSKGLAQTLQLRALGTMRKRVKSFKLRMSSPGAKEQGIALWYGLNPLPVSAFKGRPKETSTGATFRGENYAGAFVSKSKAKGKQTIFKRKGKERLPIVEQLHEIEDKAVTYLEDEVFDKVLDIFWQHFERDLKARVKFQLGGS